ncbi:MAG: MATE family efflux transporter [Emergencia sp.]|nr:MATE family efflux transporter [Emergencia sp.]
MQSKEVDLGVTPVKRLLFVLAVPAITSQVVNALYNMVDRVYIGHIPGEGAAALTGVGICFPIIMIVSAFAYLMGMGGAPRASIFMGKQDKETAEKILGNCFGALVITAAILTILLLLFNEPLLYLFGASENTIGYAGAYLTIYALGTVFVQATLGLNAFISAQGFAKVSMMTVVIGAVTNIVLDPILIFICHMGVRGAAVATVISQAISALWAFQFLRGKKTMLRLKKEHLRLQRQILLPCIGLGVAPFVMMSTESLLTLCFNTSLLKYGGDLAVGAMTILASVMQFAMMPMQGLTQGGQPIISYSFGAGNMDRLKQAVRLQVLCCFIYAAAVWALSELAPQMFAGIFTSDPELAEFTAWGLRIYMATSVLMGLQAGCQQAFIALGNAKTSAFLAIFRKILVLIPLIYILPLFFEDKVFAVFLAEPVADAIAVATTVALFTREMKRLLRKHGEN